MITKNCICDSTFTMRSHCYSNAETFVYGNTLSSNVMNWNEKGEKSEIILLWIAISFGIGQQIAEVMPEQKLHGTL